MAESLLFRHCSTSVNTGKAISGDVSANKKISKIHGEYPFNSSRYIPYCSCFFYFILFLFFIFFYEKKNRLIRADKSPWQILPQRSKRFNQVLKSNGTCRQPNLLTLIDAI